VVSNIAPVHLQHFADGIEGIARAKYELIQALPADGIAILNCDDERVARFGDGLGQRAVFYGMGDCAQVCAVDVTELGLQGVSFTVRAKGQSTKVQLQLIGRHNVQNALAAIAAGLQSGMTLEQCACALDGLRAADKRGEIREWRGARLINDSYNSNPSALDAMVDALMGIPATGRHIVVAGEMLELGHEAEALHAACGRRMAELGVDCIVGVRGLAEALVRSAAEAGATATFVATPEAAGTWLQANVSPGDVVLLKASRGVRLERALATLE
jgi:UDP-N-acetylmuramoyl-tripeptide--D-alanyl-D-alanine ligase